MSTEYQVFYDAFYNKIEKDSRFFNYFNLNSEDALELAKERSKNYLKESISRLTLSCSPDVNFNDYDDIAEVINIDATNTEIDLISNYMFEMYLQRDIALLITQNVNYTPTDLRVFDPTGARKSFMEMYLFIIQQNEKLTDSYASRDRLTGKLKTINFDSYLD